MPALEVAGTLHCHRTHFGHFPLEGTQHLLFQFSFIRRAAEQACVPIVGRTRCSSHGFLLGLEKEGRERPAFFRLSGIEETGTSLLLHSASLTNPLLPRKLHGRLRCPAKGRTTVCSGHTHHLLPLSSIGRRIYSTNRMTLSILLNILRAIKCSIYWII